MEEFAHRQNIERFQRELEFESDPDQRTLLEELLKEELFQLNRVVRQRARVP